MKFEDVSVKRKTAFVIFLVLSIAWMTVLFFLSSDTAKESEKYSEGVTKSVVEAIEPGHEKPKVYDPDDIYNVVSNIVRKIGHVLGYALLGVLTYFASGSLALIPDKVIKPVLLSVPICIVFAAGDEYHQTFVDGRSGRVPDVFIDASGVLLGTLLAITVVIIFKRSKMRK